MPSATINASARKDVTTSGSTATTTAFHERKVTKHSTTTAPYTMSSMVRHASLTTMLVAASMPADPAASRNLVSAVLLRWAKASMWPTTRARVSALWSRR
ncbi:hypothetical protein D3C72_2187260 [compost metagenome]